MLKRKNQRHVDINTPGQKFFNHRKTLLRCRDFDHEVGTVNGLKKSFPFVNGFARLVGELGVDLKTDITVKSLRLNKNRLKKIRGLLNIEYCQRVVNFERCPALLSELSDFLVIIRALADRLVENGRIGGHAAQTFVDPVFKFAAFHKRTADITQPY